jgi:hypothetical protein
MQTGIAMANRNFECILCGRKFTRFTPDALLMGENLICDGCLEALHSLGEDELQRQVKEMLSRNPSRHSPEIEKAVVRSIQQYGKARRGG